MKLKSTPEDFRVDEITSVRPSNGTHALYRLTKAGLGTPEAIAEVLSRWNIERRRISYGGLKDRHATTLQHFSIAHGPKTGFTDRSMQVEYLGQIPRPFHAKDIQANRFEIRLRKIATSQRERLDRNADWLGRFGAINYFDDQRFGSIGESGELIGMHWCKLNYERALYIALAEQNPHDRPREKEQKEILRTYWGQWEKCKAMLDRSHRRSIVTYLLDHPVDFKRALALVRLDLRSIYIAALQSWIWNRWVSTLIDRFNEQKTERHLPSKSGPLALPDLATEDRQQLWRSQWNVRLPLPSARQHHWPEGTLEDLESVVGELGLTVRELRLKFPRDTFFSRGERDVLLFAKDFRANWESTDSKQGQSDWKLAFELPRGAYATMIIRQLYIEGIELESVDDTDGEEQKEIHDAI
ncbi:MAG: tRNA pseudouridine(13) synthase TruD [Planctomycetaceae bacterium]|jgi:tRNA pseudouridine13 synthase|nr:tRNA pseudouridine(13) synthase TruD [Planctomycetaceae bacterium]